jgi:hypothetical protein
VAGILVRANGASDVPHHCRSDDRHAVSVRWQEGGGKHSGKARIVAAYGKKQAIRIALGPALGRSIDQELHQLRELVVRLGLVAAARKICLPLLDHVGNPGAGAAEMNQRNRLPWPLG